MRVKWWRFLSWGKTLNSEIFLILHSFGHSFLISFSSHDHLIHLTVIPHSSCLAFAPKGSVKSVHPTPSAEGVWRTDLTLRMRGIEPFLNDGQMTEWWQNERHFRIHFFCSLPKSLSFFLIRSFLVILECQGMKMKRGGMSLQRHPIHFHFIPTSFIIQECLRMTEWGWNDGDFWAKAKPLILKSP